MCRRARPLLFLLLFIDHSTRSVCQSFSIRSFLRFARPSDIILKKTKSKEITSRLPWPLPVTVVHAFPGPCSFLDSLDSLRCPVIDLTIMENLKRYRGGIVLSIKIILLLYIFFLCSRPGALANVETIIIKTHAQSLGMHECTYGPSYWCHNIT